MEDTPSARALKMAQDRERRRNGQTADRYNRALDRADDRQDRAEARQNDREQRQDRQAFRPTTHGPKVPEFQRTLQTFLPLFKLGVDLDIEIKFWTLSLPWSAQTGHTVTGRTGTFNEEDPPVLEDDGEHAHDVGVVVTLTQLSFAEGQSTYYDGDPSHNHELRIEYSVTTDVSATLEWPTELDGKHHHGIPPLEYTYYTYSLSYTEASKLAIAIRRGSFVGTFTDFNDPKRPPVIDPDKTIKLDLLTK